jgi:hypothetical protein
MVTFAPDLPQMNTPDWTKVTRPIDQPEADKSKGILASTAGETISGGAALAENTFDTWMKEKVHAGIDALRDTTTKAYENIRNAQVSGGKPDPRAVQTAGFDGSLMAANTDNIPEGLSAGLDKAGNLAAARSQGKANDTLYTAGLNAMAKQLRAQYPGHADYIDEQIAKISGVNPANAYMQNLLQDINRNSLKENSYEKHIMTLATSPTYFGNKEVFTALQAYKAGRPGAFDILEKAVNRAVARDYDARIQEQDRNAMRGNQADAADLASRSQVDHVYQRVQEHFNPVVNISGLTEPATLSKLINDAQSGKTSLTGPQWEQLSQIVQASRRQLETQLIQDEQTYGYGKTINDPTKLRNNRQLGLDLWDSLSTAITHKDTGGMFSIKRANDLMVSDARHQAYTSNIGQWLLDRKVLAEDLQGSPWMGTLDALNITKGSQLKDLEVFYGNVGRSASVSPDLRKQDNVKSLYDTLKAAKSAKDGGYNVPERAYKDFVENVDLIAKAASTGDNKVAANVVDYMFGPRNRDLMEFWGHDLRDEKGYHLGKEGVAHMLNDPKITDAIWNLKDGKAWAQYRDTQETWFKSNFGSQVKQLSDFAQSKIFPAKVSWDSDNHQIVLTRTDPNKSIRNLEVIKDRINNGLRDMAYMHGKEGTDTNEHLWNMLMDMGYSPTDKMEGLPPRLMEAVKNSTKSAKQRIDEAFEKK